MISNRTENPPLLFLKSKIVKTIILLVLLCLALPFRAQGQNWNFETGYLLPWSATGQAFLNQPTFGDNVSARMPGTRVGHQGEYWIGTFENRHTPEDPAGRTQADALMGTLTSAGFTINRRSISFLIGGGNDVARLRVELLVKIGPGDPEPEQPRGILALLIAGVAGGVGHIVTLPDGRYFVAMVSTGRNTDVMRREVWDVSNLRSRNARLRIKDDSDRRFGHINVDDFEVVDDVVPSPVHVTNEFGANIAGAEVFVNGVSVGVTNNAGILNISPPLTTGNNLVARKLVWENPSFRRNHAAGSTQDWNYRVYITSMAVTDNGTAPQFPVIDPLVTQELQLNRNNTLIGIHLLVTTEWDATPGELFSIRDDKLIPASQYLYNVTDGQFFIEQVELVDNADSWFDADVLVFANFSMTENALGSIRGFLNPCLCTGFRVHRGTDFKVYAHEFGHYGFGLQDEYSYLDRHAQCTGSITDPGIAAFGDGQPKASCMMWDQAKANKLCSHRAENPHMGWTLQRGMSCWTQLSMTYFDHGSRWSIQTPDTRRAIPGTLPNLLSGWAPRVAVQNNTRANLCQPFELPTVTDLQGRPLSNFEIWNSTFYNHAFIEGNTSMDNPATPDNEGGRITVTGVHVGDTLTGRGGVRFNVTSCARAGIERPPDLRGDASQLALFRPSQIGLKTTTLLEGWNHLVLEPQEGRLIARPEPFNLQVSFAPTSRAGEAEVRVTADTQLEMPPPVVLSLVGTMQAQLVPMFFDANNKTYVGLVNKLPANTHATIRLLAVKTKYEILYRFMNVSLSPVDPQKDTELGSTDGHLALTIPTGVLPPNSYVAIGPADVPPPSLAEGMVIADGPFNVLANTATEFSQPIILRFQLPVGQEPANSENANFVLNRGFRFDSQSFEIRHYNSETKAWESMGGIFLPGVDIVSVSTKQLGAYVLVARPAAAPVKTQKARDSHRTFLKKLFDNDLIQAPLGEGFRALLAKVAPSQTRAIV